MKISEFGQKRHDDSSQGFHGSGGGGEGREGTLVDCEIIR